MYIYKAQRRGSLEGKGLNRSINQSIKHQLEKEKSWSEKNPTPLQRKKTWKEEKIN
jgi:penicillin-binding protein-related factor A (putative recombinase)